MSPQHDDCRRSSPAGVDTVRLCRSLEIPSPPTGGITYWAVATARIGWPRPDHFWAWETVEEAMAGEDPLVLLDSLLEAPEADPYLGARPIVDRLVADPARWDQPLADRCRTSERWRAAPLSRASW